jgi:putative phosphoesterase
MRIAALYDIHGNLPALEAVLLEVRSAAVDHVLIGGDVLPGPMPRECMEQVRHLDLPTTFIVGNGDRATRDWRRGIKDPKIPEIVHPAMEWNADQITESDHDAIGHWPLTATMAVAGIGTVVFCHATPRNDHDIFTSETADDKLRPIFEALNANLVVCGHTHMQFDRQLGATRIINAGSVGMPIGDVGAFWVLLDNGVHFQRTQYDVGAAAEGVRATAYPHREHFAAQSILIPPSTENMLKVFSKAELT